MLRRLPLPLRIKSPRLIQPTGDCPRLSDAILRPSPASRCSSHAGLSCRSLAVHSSSSSGASALATRCLDRSHPGCLLGWLPHPSGLCSSAVSWERPSLTALTENCKRPSTIISISFLCFLRHLPPPDGDLGPGLLFVPTNDNVNFEWARTLLPPCAQIKAWHSALDVKGEGEEEGGEGEGEGKEDPGKGGRRKARVTDDCSLSFPRRKSGHLYPARHCLSARAGLSTK